MIQESPNPLSPSERARDIAYRVLEGGYDLLAACRELAQLRPCLIGISDEIMDAFIGVASEVDDLPLGSERENWAAEMLNAKDEEAAIYRERVRPMIEESLKDLLDSLGGRH